MSSSGAGDQQPNAGGGGGASGAHMGGNAGAQTAGSSGARDGGSREASTGSGGTSTSDGGTDGGSVIFFDDFSGSSIDSAKWTVFDRIGDQSNGEINCCVPANVSVAGGFLVGVSKYEDHTCGDS